MSELVLHGGIDVIFNLATLDELNVSNLNQFIWVWLIPQSFSGIIILDAGQIMNCDFCLHSIGCLKANTGWQALR